MTESMDLGCFSVSLDVDDLDASVSFYEALGFRVLGGGDGYTILGNGPTRIGLFAIPLGTNILTFNPGLTQEWEGADGETPGPGMPAPAEGFTDVREIERRLRARGIELERATETESGPDHLLLRDPDGNLIMIDQFF